MPKNKTFKFTKVQKERFVKLCDFLDKLPRKKFDFSMPYEVMPTKEETCNSAGCAIGWTPSIFPKLVERTHSGDFAWRKEGRLSYSGIAVRLFGLPRQTAWDLFAPEDNMCVDPELPQCSEVATPKQVAKMLRKFLARVEAGVYEIVQDGGRLQPKDERRILNPNENQSKNIPCAGSFATPRWRPSRSTPPGG